MSEFYNEVIKNKYLGEMENEGTANTISYAFKASKITEEILEKDLYNFTDEEVFLVLDRLAPKTYNGVAANIGYIKNYISWSIRNGYRENNINPLDLVTRKKYYELINHSSKIHYTDEEFEDLVERFDNAQDQAMVQLWFECGAKGKDFSEIKLLNYYDISWNNNTLVLTDLEGSKRTVTVSDRCMRYLQNAHKQQTYIYTREDEYKEYPLFQTNFIFKNIRHYKTKEEGVSTGVIYARLDRIKKKFNLEYFTPNAIVQSGQLHMAAMLFQRDGKLKKEQLYEIGHHYKVAMVHTEKKDYPNVSIMKQYINSRNLKELYDIDVDIKIRQRLSNG